MPEFDITWIDYTVVALYLVFTIGLGIWFARGKRDTEDYFLGGRSFTWPLVGLSFLATNHSGASYVGLSSAGYANGIAVFNYEWMAGMLLIFALFFFLPFYYRRARVFTTPEFLERRFDRRSRVAFATYIVLSSVFIGIAVALYAGAIAVTLLFPGVPLWVAVVGLAVFAGVYTITGGLAAVIVTDSVQAVMFLVGGAAIAVAVFTQIGSIEEARAAAPPDAFNLVQPLSDSELPWLGLFTGLVFINLYWACVDQVQIQRAFSARNMDHGRGGLLFGAGLKLTLLFLLILPATFANVLYPNLENPDRLFPVLAFDMLPIGLRGLLLAALIAATMSSLDSVLNSISTVFTMDFVRPARPDLSQQTLVRIGQIAATVVLVFAVIWAPQIARFDTLWGYIQSAVGFTTPPIAAAFTLGIFWKRATGTAAFATIAAGIPIGVACFFVTQISAFQLFTLQFLYAAALLFALSCALMVGVSLATAAPDEEKVRDLVWSRELWQEESKELEGKPFYANYRFWSLVFMVIVAVLVIIFW